MIIQCEKCHTKFELDESLLSAEGSRVRCSLCAHTFTAHPRDHAVAEAPHDHARAPSTPAGEGQTAPGTRRQQEIDFDNLFEASLEDLESEGIVSDDDFKEVPAEKGREDGAAAPALPGDMGGAYEPTVAVASRKRSAASRILLTLLILVLLAVGGAGAVIYWAPELIPESISILRPDVEAPVNDMGISRLSFNNVTGAFMASDKAGNLFVIRGTVKNDYPTGRSFILIRGSILDEKGDVVTRQMAYAGTSLTDEEIKAMSLEDITKAMKNRYGAARANVDVSPGAEIPFVVVFNGLPENVSEFTVEAVRSSPGTR